MFDAIASPSLSALPCFFFTLVAREIEWFLSPYCHVHFSKMSFSLLLFIARINLRCTRAECIRRAGGHCACLTTATPPMPPCHPSPATPDVYGSPCDAEPRRRRPLDVVKGADQRAYDSSAGADTSLPSASLRLFVAAGAANVERCGVGGAARLRPAAAAPGMPRYTTIEPKPQSFRLGVAASCFMQ